MSRLPKATQHDQSGKGWYTRREGVIRGPFPAENISRYILLGRIRLDDELSEDCETWTIAGQLANLLPQELASQSSWNDYQQLVIAHMEADERRGERRLQKCKSHLDSHAEQRTSPDRRSETENALLRQYQLVRAMSAGGKHPDSLRIRPVIIVALLAVLMLVWINPIQYL